jgi:hypothetical protein
VREKSQSRNAFWLMLIVLAHLQHSLVAPFQHQKDSNFKLGQINEMDPTGQAVFGLLQLEEKGFGGIWAGNEDKSPDEKLRNFHCKSKIYANLSPANSKKDILV